MNHYCTYFDTGFLVQGVALWNSLKRHDAGAVLWVLALDDSALAALERLEDPALHVVPLTDLEAGDPELAAVKAGRSRVEYFFTLSPCLPRWLLRVHPELEWITYLDADLFFFGPPAGVFGAMAAAGASVVITAHRFPDWLKPLEIHGCFNVGVQVFRNNAEAHAVLDDWRARCLEWCFDRLEGDRYADQKYLDAWPARFGGSVLVLDDPGVNFAPWNWAAHRSEVASGGTVFVDGAPLTVFHFARFRPLVGTWWWQSGQIQYGVMPWALRQAIYGTYWRALVEARRSLGAHGIVATIPLRPVRWQASSWRMLLVRVVFGTDWLRVGDWFVSGRLGFGRFSGRLLAWVQRRRLESASRATARPE